MALALVDCESFYASCERIFRPDLKNIPIVVLSNNDGCVIARSTEAKKMGIGMGVPWFKVKKDFLAVGGQVFSSNFTFYGDMSARVLPSAAVFTIIMTQRITTTITTTRTCTDLQVCTPDDALPV